MNRGFSTDELAAKAQTLFTTYRAEGFSGDPPAELVRILGQLSESSCLYERGILALLAGDDDTGTTLLRNAAIERVEEMGGPPSLEAFESEWFMPLRSLSPTKLWHRLADVFDKAHPNWAATHFLRGLAAFARKDLSAAEEAFRECLDADSTYWRAAMQLAFISAQLQKLEETRSWLQRAMENAQRDPEYASIHTLWGDCERDFGSLDTAIDHYLKVLEYQPDDWETLFDLGDLYLDSKNWRTALAYYEDAATHADKEPNETRADILFAIGLCYGKLKERSNESAAYEKCLELDPDCPYARNNLGYSLEKSGQLEAAEEVFREAIKRGNDGKYPLRNLARVLRKLGRFEEAIELCKQDTHKGRLAKHAARTIEELQALLDKQKKGDEPVDELLEEDEESEEAVGAGREEPEDDGDAGSGSLEAETPSEASVSRSRKDVATQIMREDILEDLLERRIERGREVFGRKLRMFQSTDSGYRRHGRQFPIPGVGRLDLLTIDEDSGDLVVIELKRGQSERDTVGQIRHYMGWVSMNLAAKGQHVRGIICVWEATDALRYAIHGMPDIEAFEYSLEFTKV